MTKVTIQELVTKYVFEVDKKGAAEYRRVVAQNEATAQRASKNTAANSERESRNAVTRAEREARKIEAVRQRQVKAELAAINKAAREATAATEKSAADQAKAIEASAKRRIRALKEIERAQREVTGGRRGRVEKDPGGDSTLEKIGIGAAGSGLGGLAADAIKAIAAAVAQLGKEIVVTAAKFESLRARLKTVEGSSEGAATAFATIQNFAKSTPFEVEDITTAFVQLRVRGINPTTEKLTALGDFTSAFGYGFQEMTDAIGAAARGELDPIEKFGIAAKITGDKIKLSFRGQTEIVDRSADAVTNVLVKWGQMQGIQGAMAEQSKTTAGMFSNLKDTISALFDQVGQMGVLDEVKKLMDALSASIGGEGLAKVIADVLVMALRTVRELFESLPQETLIEFVQNLVTALGMLIGMLVDTATSQTGVFDTVMQLLSAFLELWAAIHTIVESLKEIKESLGGIPGPIDILIKALQTFAQVWTFIADKLAYLLTLLQPLLDMLGNMADRLPSINDLLSTLGAKLNEVGGYIDGLTNNFFNLTDSINETRSAAEMAKQALKDLAEQGDYKKKSDAELQELRRQGDARADAEIKRRMAERENVERQEAAAEQVKERQVAQGKRADRMLDNPGRLSRDVLTAMTQDATLTEKQRDKAQKELDKRDNKKPKKEKLTGLEAQIEAQFKELTGNAEVRASARALREGKSPDEAFKIGKEAAKATEKRLRDRFESTGELPMGISRDIQQLAASPAVEDSIGKVPPPVISVTNNVNNVSVTGNSFATNVEARLTDGTTVRELTKEVTDATRRMIREDLGEAVANVMPRVRV